MPIHYIERRPPVDEEGKAIDTRPGTSNHATHGQRGSTARNDFARSRSVQARSTSHQGEIMRYRTLLMGTFLALAFSTGCYHATVETGLAPSPQKVNNQWAAGWIYGLVPPKTVETLAKCPKGAAVVETQLSFANQLVSFLTGGIYTPMSITVTCAASP